MSENLPNFPAKCKSQKYAGSYAVPHAFALVLLAVRLLSTKWWSCILKFMQQENVMPEDFTVGTRFVSLF